MGQTFTYDALDRLTRADGPYGSAGYAYDAHGNRQSASGSTYAIDPDTLRLATQNGVPFGYDSNGNLTSTPAATYIVHAGKLAGERHGFRKPDHIPL